MMMDASNSSKKSHPSVFTRISILTCLALGPILWRHRVEIRAHFQGPRVQNRKKDSILEPPLVPSSNSNLIDDSSVILSVDLSHKTSNNLLLDEWTPSPVKNVNYTDKFMVPVLEQHEQRRELRELLVTESKAWRIGKEPEFVSIR